MADSIRVDTASLISGALVIGDHGHGVLGADVPSLSFFRSRVTLPADAGKEFRALITRWPPVGVFTPYEDGTYVYVGIDADFDYQLYIDGVASGAPVTVPLTTGGVKPLEGAAAAQAAAAGSLSKTVNLAGDAVAVATAAMAGAGFDSIRVDLDSLIDGAIVVGDLGHGVLGSQIPSTGPNGASFLWNDIDPVADANKEIRGHVTRWAAAGELYVHEDGSFTYLGPSTDFDYQLYVDGIAIGAPVTVDIYIPDESDLAGDAAGVATAAGGLSVGKSLTGAASGRVTATGSLPATTRLRSVFRSKAQASTTLRLKSPANLEET